MSSATIAARLLVELGLDANQYKRELLGALDKTKEAGGVVGAVSGAMSKSFVAVGAAATAVTGIFTLATKSMLDMSDHMTNLSERTGIGVEALQKFQFAGAAVGVSADAIAMSMQRFQRSMVGGSEGTTAALKKIGLSIADLKKMAPEEQFVTLMESLAKLPNAAERSATAIGLLGRSGAQLLGLGNSLRETMKRAEELGVVMSSKTVAAADQLGDELGVLSMAWGGVMNNLGAAITGNAQVHAALEVVIKAVGTLSQFIYDNRATISGWVSTGVLFAVEAIEGFVGTTAEWVRALGLVGGTLLDLKFTLAGWALSAVENISKVSIALMRLTSNSPEIIAKAKKLFDDIEGEIRTSIPGIVKAQTTWNREIAGTAAQLDAWKTNVHKMGEAIRDAKGPLDGAATSVKKVGDGAEGASAKVRALADSFSGVAMRKEMGEMAEAVTLAGGAQKLYIKDVESMGPKLEEMKARFGTLPPVLEEVRQRFDDLTVNVSRLAASELFAGGVGGMFGNAAAQMLAAADAARRYGTEVAKLTTEQVVGAFGMFGNAGAELVGLVKVYGENTTKAVKATLDWGQSLQTVASLVQAFGGMGSIFSSIAAGIAGIATTMQGVVKSMANVLGPKAGFMKSFLGLFKQGPAGILGGITAGLSLASAAVGIGKAIVGLFKTSPAEKAMKEAGKITGQKISKSLAEAIAKSSKDLGISMGNAVLLNINKIIDESGKAASSFGTQIMDLMGAVAKGTIPLKEGVAAVGEAFSKVRAEAEAGSVAAAKLSVQMIQAARAAGMKVPEITEAVRSSLELATKGVESITKNLKIGSAEDAKAQAYIFAGVFWGQVKELGILGAAQAMGPAWEALQKSLKEKFGSAADAILAPIKSIMGLVTNEATKPIAEGIQGLQDALKGLSESGYMTTGAFGGLQQQALSAFEDLKGEGVDANTALQALAPLLGQLQTAASTYGLTLDANTQALVDQAKAAGVAFPTDPMQQVVSLLTVIAQQLGATIPAAVSNTTNSLGTIAPAAQAVASSTSTALQAVAISADGTASMISSSFTAAFDSASSGAWALAGQIKGLDAMTVSIPFKFEGGLPESFRLPEPIQAQRGVEIAKMPRGPLRGGGTPLVVHPGERVSVTPAGRRGGRDASATYNVYAQDWGPRRLAEEMDRVTRRNVRSYRRRLG